MINLTISNENVELKSKVNNGLLNETYLEKILPSHVKRVVLNVSETCFLKCEMCFFWKNKLKDLELDFNTWTNFFKSLKKIKGPETDITFTGGESLAVPNIYKLLALSAKHGFPTNVNTNGWLINDKIIKRLFDAHISEITFSLDGSCPEIHDKIRGMPGSFDRVIKNAERIKRYFNTKDRNISINITCVISASNIYDVINLTRLAQERDFISDIWLQTITAPFFDSSIQRDRIASSGVSKYWYEHEKYSYLWPRDKNEIIKLYSELIFMKRKGYKIANSDDHLKMQCNYFINPQTRLRGTICNVTNDLNMDMMRGFAFQCLRRYRDEPIGDIKKDPIDNIWNSSRALSLRRKMAICGVSCHEVMNCNKKVEIRE